MATSLGTRRQLTAVPAGAAIGASGAASLGFAKRAHRFARCSPRGAKAKYPAAAPSPSAGRSRYHPRMPQDPPKQRLLRLLRRTTKGARALGERTTADESALWSAHERALVRARDAGSAAQRIASSAARQRASIDAVADRARGLGSGAAPRAIGNRVERRPL